MRDNGESQGTQLDGRYAYLCYVADGLISGGENQTGSEVTTSFSADVYQSKDRTDVSNMFQFTDNSKSSTSDQSTESPTASVVSTSNAVLQSTGHPMSTNMLRPSSTLSTEGTHVEQAKTSIAPITSTVNVASDFAVYTTSDNSIQNATDKPVYSSNHTDITMFIPSTGAGLTSKSSSDTSHVGTESRTSETRYMTSKSSSNTTSRMTSFTEFPTRLLNTSASIEYTTLSGGNSSNNSSTRKNKRRVIDSR